MGTSGEAITGPGSSEQPINDGEHSVLGGTACVQAKVLFPQNYILKATEMDVMNLMVQSAYVTFAVTVMTERNIDEHPAIMHARYALLGLLSLLIRKRQPRQRMFMQEFSSWMNRFIHGLSDAQSKFIGGESSLTTPGRLLIALQLGLLSLKHHDAWQKNELQQMFVEEFSVSGSGAEKLKANFWHDEGIAVDLADFVHSVAKFSQHTDNTDAVDVIVPVYHALEFTGHSLPWEQEVRKGVIHAAFTGMTYMTRETLQGLSGDARVGPVAVLFACRMFLAAREDVEIRMPLDYLLRKVFTKLGVRPSTTTPVPNPVIEPLIAAAGSGISGDYMGALINLIIAVWNVWNFCQDESPQRQHVVRMKTMITGKASDAELMAKATELSLSLSLSHSGHNGAEERIQFWLGRKKRQRDAEGESGVKKRQRLTAGSR